MCLPEWWEYGRFDAQDEAPPDLGEPLSPWRAKLLVMEAREAIVRKDFAYAEAAVDAALERDPQNGDASLDQGKHPHPLQALSRGGHCA